MKWQPIDSAPLETLVLVRFRSGHVEDASIHLDANQSRYHVLFDGQTLNDEPRWWMPYPEPPK